MNRQFAPFERGSSRRLARRIRQYVERSRQEELAREIAADTERDELWAEAAERERLRAREIQNAECRVPRAVAAAKDHDTVLVVHSSGAGEKLERLTEDRARLRGMVSDGGSAAGKSWLFFEPQQGSPLRQKVDDHDTR